MSKKLEDRYWYKYQQEYWSTDVKPKGRIKRLLKKSGRQHAKSEIRKELKKATYNENE